MEGLRVHALGTFEIRAADGTIVALEARRSQELLTYLLTRPSQCALREVAIDALWPDVDCAAGKKQIRQALWQIHHAVDDGAGENCTSRLILAEGDHLAMNPDREVWCDAVELGRLADPADAEPMEPACRHHVEGVLEHYRGAFLDFCYSEWCLIERERLETTYLLGLDAASVRAEERGDRTEAIRWARELLLADSAHERSHRRLMRLYSSLGDRTGALRQFGRCVDALRAEFDVEPSDRTRSVADAIRCDRALPISPGARGAAASPPVARPRANGSGQHAAIMREISTLQSALDGLRRSVEQLT